MNAGWWGEKPKKKEKDPHYPKIPAPRKPVDEPKHRKREEKK